MGAAIACLGTCFGHQFTQLLSLSGSHSFAIENLERRVVRVSCKDTDKT